MEDVTQSLLDAVGIMFLGMGLVYLFLSILILGIHLVARWCAVDADSARYVKNHAKSQQRVAQSDAKPLDPNVVAAISLAVKQYRSQIK
ncbi:OadG family transporter subunit [Shewanella sp. SP2S2-4]|uniref:OadG family transporter subunit n=1 Tax=Shewanella sp. SP2S2-4 TaxID=3063539 RepID=UPI00288E9B83|nr:OadG family transporter subunit [Shewanella sp. SP2S2-4]MDT3273156.1 OadG family transporter subunit [Shewanella sp. SP2S2-4]